MENITEIEVESPNGEITVHILIDNGNDTFTSMLKSTWDEQQAQNELGGTL